jgi:hypothetical protein
MPLTMSPEDPKDPKDEKINDLVREGAHLIGERKGETKEELAARILHLESELKTIQAGKDAAERMLKADRERALELAQNSNFSLKRDWVALVNELRFLKGKELGEGATPQEESEYQESLVIDFCNRLRIGALADLESKDDETLYVIAKSYEVWYKACTAVLANRALKLKIDKTSEFEAAKLNAREKEKEIKRAKAEAKEDKRRRTPEEKMLDSLRTLGMSETQAREHMKQMQSAALNMLNKQ